MLKIGIKLSIPSNNFIDNGNSAINLVDAVADFDTTARRKAIKNT